MTLFWLLLVASFGGLAASVFYIDVEDGRLTTPQITVKYGYRTETHKVETYDGFFVVMHRLRASPSKGPFDARKPPVLLMHGLLGSSGDWIMIGPKNALPYLLADQGYDVWLGNARGNRYSGEHAYLTDDMREYWDFSWHEIGIYDVPTMVDHVLKTRKVKQLHYVGHSQGTTSFLVMTSMMPEYNKKIIKMHALAPAAYLYHLNNPAMRFLATHMITATNIANAFGVNQLLPSNPLFHQLARVFCPNYFNFFRFCINSMFLISAGEYHSLDPNLIPVLTGHIPAGASAKQFIHYGQEVLSGHFRQFDYGPGNNTEIYQAADPPDYNLTNVRAPVAIYYGLNDQLTHPEDVGRLAQELPNVVAMNQLPNASFNHMDFLVAANVRSVLQVSQNSLQLSEGVSHMVLKTKRP
ncbi:hypothetical protein pipiens_004723 [Culex pipiens pipiens]|uniref:Lipase n=1 Tax=Culex pipiens pipiens TaxID=38569 RepID=A0ABD1CFW1_CULPP